MVHEGCCKNFPTRVGNLKASTTAKENPQDGYNNLSDSHAAVDRVRRVAVEDLVFSQEDKPKRHQSAREISCETFILCSSVHKVIYHNLQFKCFKTTSCSAVV